MRSYIQGLIDMLMPKADSLAGGAIRYLLRLQRLWGIKLADADARVPGEKEQTLIVRNGESFKMAPPLR
jgi:hypothetical protein